MKKLFTWSNALLLVMMTSACGISGEDFWGRSYITDRFQGLPDAIFYQTKGSCADGDLVFSYLVGGGAILWDVPQTQSENDILTGQVFIFLNRDLTYTVDYREYDFNNLVIQKKTASTFSFEPETQVITLKDLGTATIHRRKNRYFLRVTFTENLNSQFLRGQTIDVWVGSSQKGLNADIVDHCGL